MFDLWLVSRSRTKRLSFEETIQVGRLLAELSGGCEISFRTEEPTTSIVIMGFDSELPAAAGAVCAEVLGSYSETHRPNPKPSSSGHRLLIPRAPLSELIVQVDEEELRISPRTMVVCLDETGNESFNDPNYPMFGLAGWACLAGHVDQAVTQPWWPVQASFRADQLPLHAADLRPDEITPEQGDSLLSYFLGGAFHRLAVVLFEGAIPADVDPLHLAYRLICDQVLTHAVRLDADALVVLFEESHRSQTLVTDYLHRYKFGRRLGDVAPISGYAVAKSSGIEGVQVADFIAHTAGASAYSFLRGGPGYDRVDFQAVFGAGERSSYLGVTRAATQV